MNVSDKEFVILGAGISGCALAWVLHALGAKVRIIEKDGICGGLAKTFYLNKHPYEFGPHIFHATQPATILFYQKYGVRTLDYYTKMVYNNSLDTLVDFPFSLDTIFQLPREVAKQVVAELYKLNPEKVDRTNLDTYLRSVLGNTFYEAFNYDYSKKFWGRIPADMPSNAAAGWINFRTSDKRLFPEWQGYPQKDFNAFFEWLVKDIEVIQAKILGLGNVNQGKLRSVKSNKGEIEGEYFISTIPPKNLFNDVDKRLEYVGKILVALHVDRGPVFPPGIGGIYFPSHWQFNRVVEYPAINDANYPSFSQGSLLGVEYPIFSSSEVKKKDKYIEDAKLNVSKLWPCKIIDAEAMWHPDVYPVRNKQQLAIYEEYCDRAKTTNNLQMTGRYGSFKYLNMNNCIELALEKVAEITKMSVNNLAREVGLCG